MHESLRDRLFAMQDTAYRDFHSRLIPNIDPERVIGIRTPALRAFAKEFSKTNEADEFLAARPHFFYEENNLHAMLVCQKKDFAGTVRLLDAFLPHVDNWATCDLMKPKPSPRSSRCAAAERSPRFPTDADGAPFSQSARSFLPR